MLFVAVSLQLYHSKFKKYLVEMKKLQEENKVDKTDLLGTDENKTGGFFSSKKSASHLIDVFRLNGRDAVLADSDKDLIIPHIAGTTGQRILFERIFKSAQNLLVSSLL